MLRKVFRGRRLLWDVPREKAELLLTPSVATAPSIEKPAQEIPLPPAEATQSPHAQPSKDVVQDTERQKAEREQKRLAEADRLRALRLQQADQALAEARRLDASRETARPSNPPRPKIRASKLPNTKPAARSKPQSAPAPIHTKAKGETRGPMTVRQSPPRYPRNLERKGIGGKVSVLINIDSKGRVSSASVNRSSGHKELDKAATAAVKRWRFKPALKDGEKSASKTAVDIVFQPKS